MSTAAPEGAGRAQPRIHARVHVAAGEVVLRDFAEADLEPIADYWNDADAAFLQMMGVDRAKLGTRDELIGRFRGLIPNPEARQSRLGFAVELAGMLIGYTNLNHYSAEDNVSHWHLIDSASRRQGISTALYPYRLRTYFSCVAMERLTHQTRTSNPGMNRVLDRFVPIAETRFLEKPDGLAAPGEFNIRYVSRADAQRILAETERFDG